MSGEVIYLLSVCVFIQHVKKEIPLSEQRDFSLFMSSSLLCRSEDIK